MWRKATCYKSATFASLVVVSCLALLTGSLCDVSWHHPELPAKSVPDSPRFDNSSAAPSRDLFVRKRTRWCLLDEPQEARRSQQSGCLSGRGAAIAPGNVQTAILMPREREVVLVVERNFSHEEIALELGI